MNGYVIQPGDKLLMVQYQSVAKGGLMFNFSDGSNSNWTVNDQDGNTLNSDNASGTWHNRAVPLDAFAAKTISGTTLVVDGYTPAGSWDIYYFDIVIVSADGSVHPFYTHGPSISLTVGGSAGSTRAYEVQTDHAAGIYWDYTATYYHGDHLGSSRLLTNGQGYPVWQGTFLPYGEEFDKQLTNNHYQFTGKERDTESGNDYFGARYYASSMGRFMSPDPLPWIHWQNGNRNDREKFAAYIANPQNFDLYAYVLNNPLSKTDPTGMYVCNGNQQQCQAVQNSLDAVKRAADALSKGNATEQALGKKLNGILSFYGKAGDDNGVKVGFADLASHGAWGSTHSSSFFGMFKSTSITFDYHAFNQGYAFGAETVAHEGAHGVDGAPETTWSGTPKWSSMLGTETHAYQAEAATDRGLGTTTASDGNSPVWNTGWGAAAEGNSANAINANATSNASFSCASSGGCDGQP